jgi:putative DNA primase/helicase
MPKVSLSLPKAENLPADLVRRKQWVGWKYVTKKGSTEPTKVPLQASGEDAKSNDPATWTTFRNICAKVAKSNGQFDGIGFVFSEEDEFAGIDLDNCLTENGEVRDWARPILNHFIGTYKEVSPSGRGVKIWCKDKRGRGRKIEFHVDGVKCAVEAYSQGRYFTVTGKRFVWGASGTLRSVMGFGPRAIKEALEIATSWPSPHRLRLLLAAR